MTLRILLADDHKAVREGLKEVLEHEGFTVIGEAADGREAVQLALTLKPEIALLDLAMPFKTGIEAAGEILSALPATKLIILTVHRDREYISQAIRAGVHGYILKTRAVAELKSAITEVTKGNVYLSPDIPREQVDTLLLKKTNSA